MKVKLTRKLANLINGVDLSQAHTGDMLELSEKEAMTLIAEGWAAPASDVADGREKAHDRPRKKRGPQGDS